MAEKKYDLEAVRELWRQEPRDKAVFKAATEDIEEYPSEIQAIIKEEAERRRKINKASKGIQRKPWFLRLDWNLAFGVMFFLVAKLTGATWFMQISIAIVGMFVGSVVGVFVEMRAEAKRRKLVICCPECGRSLKGATKEMIGDMGVCPKCKTEFRIEPKSEDLEQEQKQ